MSNTIIEEELDEQDKLAEVFAQYLNDGTEEEDTNIDSEVMTISIDHIVDIAKQLRIHGYYFGSKKDSQRDQRMKMRRLRDLKAALDPDNTNLLEFVKFTEEIPKIVKEVENEGELDSVEVVQEIDVEPNQVQVQYKDEYEDEDQEMEDLDELMQGSLSESGQDPPYQPDINPTPTSKADLEQEATKNIKSASKPKPNSKAKSKKPIQRRKPSPEPEPFDYDRLSSFEKSQILKDFKLFTQGEDRPITLDDLIRVAKMVDGDVIHDDEELISKKQEKGKEEKVQTKPPFMSDLIDMLQLHAPDNSSDKPEINLRDFGNILHTADLL